MIIVVGDGSDRFAVTSPVKRVLMDAPMVYKQDGILATRNSGRIDWFARDTEWKDEKDFRGIRDVEKPLGMWNRLECIAKNGKPTIILNGVTVNQAVDVTPRKGRIQIQSEAAEIFFRRFFTKREGGNEPPYELLNELGRPDTIPTEVH